MSASEYLSDKPHEPILDRVATALSKPAQTLTYERLRAETGLQPHECDVAIHALVELGMYIEVVDGIVRYCPQDPLEIDWLEEHIDAEVVLRRVCSSTNHMAAQWRGGLPVLCLSEVQTCGRGRQGRKWVQPYGLGLMMSVGFSTSRHDAGAMALAISVALAEGLRAVGFTEVGVKWPNDLYAGGSKLGGLLVLADGGGRGRLVVGFGLNVHCSPNLGEVPTVCVSELTSSPVSRNVLAAHCAREIIGAVHEYRCYGFAPFYERWNRYDALFGSRIQIQRRSDTISGVACGIDSDGSLMLATGSGTRKLQYGEVSLHR